MALLLCPLLCAIIKGNAYKKGLVVFNSTILDMETPQKYDNELSQYTTAMYGVVKNDALVFNEVFTAYVDVVENYPDNPYGVTTGFKVLFKQYYEDAIDEQLEKSMRHLFSNATKYHIESSIDILQVFYAHLVLKDYSRYLLDISPEALMECVRTVFNVEEVDYPFLSNTGNLKNHRIKVQSHFALILLNGVLNGDLGTIDTKFFTTQYYLDNIISFSGNINAAVMANTVAFYNRTVKSTSILLQDKGVLFNGKNFIDRLLDIDSLENRQYMANNVISNYMKNTRAYHWMTKDSRNVAEISLLFKISEIFRLFMESCDKHGYSVAEASKKKVELLNKHNTDMSVELKRVLLVESLVENISVSMVEDFLNDDTLFENVVNALSDELASDTMFFLFDCETNTYDVMDFLWDAVEHNPYEFARQVRVLRLTDHQINEDTAYSIIKDSLDNGFADIDDETLRIILGSNEKSLYYTDRTYVSGNILILSDEYNTIGRLDNKVLDLSMLEDTIISHDGSVKEGIYRVFVFSNGEVNEYDETDVAEMKNNCFFEIVMNTSEYTLDNTMCGSKSIFKRSAALRSYDFDK